MRVCIELFEQGHAVRAVSIRATSSAVHKSRLANATSSVMPQETFCLRARLQPCRTSHISNAALAAEVRSSFEEEPFSTISPRATQTDPPTKSTQLPKPTTHSLQW